MMLKQVSRTFVPLMAVLQLAAGISLYGQVQSGAVAEAEDAALASFEEGLYRQALKGFRALLVTDAFDPLYTYYTGRCLVAINQELDEAIELLYRATQQRVYPDALLYLGKAYHLNYNFPDALRCFERFEMTASRQEKNQYQVKHLIETCHSAAEITSFYNPFEVMNVTFLDLSDSMQFSQVKMKGGDLSRKPEAYFQNEEDRNGLTGLMFIPKNPVRGDYLYYSGYENKGKDGAQLFRIRKGSGNSWSDPEEVSFLNSSGNEILPYFDPIENDLYFASDGRFGLGGFDLYKSHYDVERDQWTDPVNLGFPVNSVMDEYLLLPGTDLGMVLFFSSREGTDSTVAVYRVHLTEPKKKLANGNFLMLREIAQLGGAGEEILAGIGEAEQTEEVAIERTPENKPVPSYQETLAEALRYQALSDSLKDLASNARIRVRESDDPNDRWVWQKQIMVWEKNARDEEARADQLYARMEKERTKSSGPAVNPPETIVADRVIDGLTVYRYADPDTTANELTSNPGPSLINRFDILDHSPYSDGHPIPMDVILPVGTLYRIQLGAFAVAVEPDTYGGISPIAGEHLADRGLVKYYAGEFSRYEDASSALPRIHSLGFEDAFIVAWYNGNPVPTQKAKQLE